MKTAPHPITRRGATVVGLLALAATIAGCGGSDGEDASDTSARRGETTTSAKPGHYSETYAKDEMWLCRPGNEVDHCLDADLTGTEYSRELVPEEVPFTPATDPTFDCFYVYPTVDLSMEPANHTELTDVSFQLDPLTSQAARFASICDVYAPLYREATLGGTTALNSADFETMAYGDVVDAFEHYLAQHNDGRPFVLIGHSQGANLLTRLLQEKFDNDPARLSLLISALLIGSQRVFVPTGQQVGGTFQNLPLCTSRGQTGCVIAYNTYEVATPPPNNGGPFFFLIPDGMQAACTNPAALEGGKGQLRGSWFPLVRNQATPVVVNNLPAASTPFVLYREYFRAECRNRGEKARYLGIDRVTDPAEQRPADLGNEITDGLASGLHGVDIEIALADLLFIVETQAASFSRAS